MNRVPTPAEVDHLAGRIRRFMAAPGATFEGLAAHLLETALKTAPLLPRVVEVYGGDDPAAEPAGRVEVRVSMPPGVVAGHEAGCVFGLTTEHDPVRLAWQVDEVGLSATLAGLIANTGGLLVDQVADGGHVGARESRRAGR